VFALLLPLGCGGGGETRTAASPSRRDGIVRLEPREFPELPMPIRRELESRFCTVPQTYLNVPRQNVISGHFRDSVAVDWAVLCSREGRSTILVFWSGSVTDVAAIQDKEDAGGLQGIGDGKVGFSRFIGTAPPTAMLQNRTLYGASDFPPILHDGIEEAFAEKGSVVHYLHEQTWYRFLAGD
jgi:hypothetical protein